VFADLYRTVFVYLYYIALFIPNLLLNLIH